MSLADRGSVYDKIINEDWYSTPDMGDYMNNQIYKDKIDVIDTSNKKGKEFYFEAPPVLSAGYHKSLGVVAIKANPQSIHTQSMTDKDTEYNFYDGDTIVFPFSTVQDTQEMFQVYYSETRFKGVRHYLKETLSLNEVNDMIKIRFVGLNAPEVVHYANVRGDANNDDIIKAQYKTLVDKNAYVKTDKGRVEKFTAEGDTRFSFCPYKNNGGNLSKRDPEEWIEFLKTNDPNEGIRFKEVIKTVKSQNDYINRKCVVAPSQYTQDMDYHVKSLLARDVVRKSFGEAEECIMLLDTRSSHGKKADIPESYKRSFERSIYNPFYSIYDMWKSILGEKPAYQYAGYRVPGQEANGRFMGAIYLKIKGQWINLNKKVIFDCDRAIARPEYTSSPDSIINGDYLATGFKLWTYDRHKQIYIDDINPEILKNKDDRKKIQEQIAGCNLDEMVEHTMMIGDTLFMIPPTSIRSVTQTKSSRTQLLRAKGSVHRGLPKTERLLQIDLFFNKDEGINGIPYKQQLPNGETKVYYMNGLRSLIAQFKLAPFLPIHNNYVNNTLNIDAVALSNYTVTTVPNFPRTLQVTLMMYEFDWSQFMPSQAAPDITGEHGLYVNGFSETMHFPLLRYFYQRALERGEDLKNGSLQEVPPNHPDYINATIGNKTALQPMDFKEPLVKFYIPNRDWLDLRKQTKMNLLTQPLGQKFEFSDKEKDFIKRMHYINNTVQAFISSEEINGAIIGLTKSNTYGEPFLYENTYTGDNVSGIDLIKSYKASMIQYGDNANKINYNFKDVSKNIVVPIYYAAVNEFKKNQSNFGNAIEHFDLTVLKEYADEKVATLKLSLTIKINRRFFDDGSSLDKIRKYCGKNTSEKAEDIFKDNEIKLTYLAKFKRTSAFDESRGAVINGFALQTTSDINALRYLAALNDSNTDGSDDFNSNDAIEDANDANDMESAKSIKFDEFYIGQPIITSLTSSYNNYFSNVSLKALDGHASQYTGGSDSSLEIEMIAEEETVGQINFLSRLCVKNLIDYRKILKSSPLRIDSDFTRLLGLYEVIIDSIDISTIPDYPGKFKINMQLSSVDRTLRNRESLKRIQDIDNSSTQSDLLISTKNFFDLKKVLGKAEIYPDLELPTIEELEKIGFYFLKSKYQPERVYPDPDFYFLYWYPTFANLIKTSITEFFQDPQNFKYDLNGAVDKMKDAFTLDINVKNKKGESIFKVLDWDKRSSDYDAMTEKIKEMAKNIKNKDKEKEFLTEEQSEDFVNLTSGKLKRLSKVNKIMNSLQETIDNSVYNAYQVNKLTNVTVKDVDILDSESQSELKAVNEINERVKKVILDELKKPITDNKFTVKKDTETILFFKPKRMTDLNTDLFNKIAEAVTGKVQYKLKKDCINYISDIIKAGGVGAMATQGIFNAPKDEINKGYGLKVVDQEPPCYPPKNATITNSNGDIEKVPICLYESPVVSELVIAHDDATRAKGVLFGRFGIRKYHGNELSRLFKIPKMQDGFLDPYFNSEISKDMYGEDINTDPNKLESHIKGLTENEYYSYYAHMRQILVWLYVLIEQGVFLNLCFYYSTKLIDFGDKSYNNRLSDESVVECLSKTLYEEKKDQYESESIVETITNKVKGWKYEDEFNQLLGEGAYDNVNKAIEGQEKRIKELVKKLKENSRKYTDSLIAGLFYSLSAIAMSGLDSDILRAISDGDMSQYSQLITNAMGVNSYEDLSEEQKKVSRFVQYCNYFFDEEERYERNAIQNISYNNKIQRAYLKAAEDPTTYMLHSFYDMVVHDKRGSMARAFPTYYMLLIDEGRNIGLWKLQDNFYDMNSIIEFEVVKSRKIAADTAKIVMTNMYGTFTSEDEDMKDEYGYTMKDVWDSIWSPRKYFQQEYVRRKNARDINRAKMQPGARVHLRMGYSSNAADLPIVFNGCVAEFQAGETMTLICQGDGVELANPHMFNAMDAADVQDIKHSDDFFGWKQLVEKWDNLSTPRDLLVLPLAAEGSWIQEIIRKYSNGRFFNANPFGIVHFGDRRYTSIFTTNGEVEQNIYEAVSKPAWSYEKAGMDIIDDGIEIEYSMSEAPKVKVDISQGMSYWDLMHIASSLSPDYICAIAPFQLRSTIFHGHPRFYYAFDYVQIDGKVIEKRKPFQQYHIYTSYSDIVDNKISTSQTDVRTNIVGHYTGPGWVSKKPKTVGPLWLDIDIFPEYQKSTSVNLNFEYKNSDFMPFNLPIADKVIDMFEWKDGPNGEKTAWRATASALKDTVKDMYKGELIVLGDPTAKPYDRFTVFDNYEDMGGLAEIETVTHMFTTETGFTTSITPDCISAIDNKYEVNNHALITQSLVPAVFAEFITVGTNLMFHKINRPAYLGLARAARKGGNELAKAVNSVMSTVGKEAVQRDAMVISSDLPENVKAFLGISASDIAIYDAIKDLLSVSKRFNPKAITSGKSFIHTIENFEKLEDILKSAGADKIDDITEILSDKRFSKALDKFNEINKGGRLSKAVDAAKSMASLSSGEVGEIAQALKALNSKDDEILSVIKILDKSKDGIDFTTKEGKAFLKTFKAVGTKVDDFTTGGLGSVSTLLTKKAGTIKKSLKTLDEVEDVARLAGTAKAAWTAKGLLMNNAVSLVAQIVLCKGAQEYLTRKLRNLQVLTVFPLKKDNRVWTAGLNGHQGSVFGSPSYDQPGWLESLAIKFFDYGSNEGDSKVSTILGLLRDMFITTDEMKEIVDSYKRGNNYVDENHSADKQGTEIQQHLLETLAKNSDDSYATYKQIYFTKRLTMNDVKTKSDEAKQSYAFYKMAGINNIEQSKELSEKLKYVVTSSDLINKLYTKQCFRLANDYDSNGVPMDYKNVRLQKKNILRFNGTETDTVYVKEIGSSNPKVFDIPYLRPDASIVLNQVVVATLRKLQPDFENPTCEFENVKKHPFVLQSGTRVNSNAGWRSTGFLFTLEVKNYDNFSNIIKEVEKQRDEMASDLSTKIPFSVKKENTAEYGVNAYSFFVHCPKI